jgi:ABC-type thiamin/hydroxymethylpyrimidine transport system permease subunit
MEPTTRRKGQAVIFAGMAACAASLILRRFGLDFLSGVSLGISLALFFLGFRASYRR